MQSTSAPQPVAKRAGKGFVALAAALLVTAIIVSLAIGWHKSWRYELFPRNFGVVERGQIYRSGQLTTRMLREVIKQDNIRTVIALNNDEPDSTQEQQVCDELGVRRFVLPMRGDGTGDPAIVARAVNLISDPEMRPVLVHCAAGAQRTTTVVMLYRHLVQGESIAETYPESFGFKHKPDEWKLLAWIADNLPEVKAALAEKSADEPRASSP